MHGAEPVTTFASPPTLAEVNRPSAAQFFRSLRGSLREPSRPKHQQERP